MKKSRFISAAMALVVVPALALTLTVKAADPIPPSIEGGDIFWAKNLTKNNTFVDPNSADACDELMYRVRIHNAGQDQALQNVTVQASIPSGASTKNVSSIVVRASNASPSSTSDTATVNLSSSQKVSYVAGSTQLLDNQGNVLSGLSDAIVGSGVSIGNVGISIGEQRFVQFKAKVDCPKPVETPQPTYACTNLEISAENRTVRITNFTTSQTNGATFKHAVISWGDNSANMTTSEAVGKSHTYNQAGTYTVTATAYFTVNGQEVSASAPACSKSVTFKDNTPPTVVTASNPTATIAGAPTKLVNSGPGEMAVLFLLVTFAGYMAYYRVIVRKLDQ